MKINSCPLLVSVAVGLLMGAPAHARSGPYYVVELNKTFGSLQDALWAIGTGDGTIRIQPGTYHDCGVQEGGRVAFIAEEPGSVIFDGKVCEDKAAFVLRGRDTIVEGIVFQNMRVDDGNGAGIRLERGSLTINQSVFRNSEQGILTANDASGHIKIGYSTFSRLGRCDRGLSCAHSIYVNHFGSLSVRNSRFEMGDGGHYVKSRAPRIEVIDSSFDDSKGNATNYMIDLPAGARGVISGNTFVVGGNKENRTGLIAVRAEETTNSSAGLKINANDARLAPGVDFKTSFVVDWSHERLDIGENKLGAGIRPFETR